MKKSLLAVALPLLVLASCTGIDMGSNHDSSEPLTSSEIISSIENSTSIEVSSSEEITSSEVISSEMPSSSETPSSEIPSSEIPSSSELPSSSEIPSSENPSSEDPVLVNTVIPGVNALAAFEVGEEVSVTEAYVFYTYHGGSLIGVATPLGTFSVSYFSSQQEVKNEVAAILVGDYVDVTGMVTISTGGDQARAKHIMPTAIGLVTTRTWQFDRFESAKVVDMETEFKDFGDALTTNDLGVVYTFTNVKFMTVGSASLTTTGYDYLNYNALVAGKNNILTSTNNYYRLGMYHYSLDTSIFNTTNTYTIQAFLVGCNQNLPWSGTSNAILRLGTILSFGVTV